MAYPIPVLPTIRYGNEVSAQYLLGFERAVQFLMRGGSDGAPIVRLGADEAQEIPDDEDAVILWNVAISNAQGMWDADDPGTITFPVAGHYWYRCSFQYGANTNGTRKLWPLINGVDLEGSDDCSEPGAGLETLTVTGFFTVAEATTVQFLTKQTSGGPIFGGTGNFNPRLDIAWWGRLSGQMPAYDAGDASELPEGFAAALAAMNDRMALMEARLNALESTQPTPPPDPDVVTQVVRINSGGGGFTDARGVAWEADRGATNGTVSLQGSGHAYGTQFDDLYFSELWGPSITYAIGDLPIGTATVRLHFSENHAATDAVGERIFDITVNGVLARDNYDIYAEAGAQYTPVVEEIATTIPGTGVCTIQLTSSVNAATIQGIEILCEGDTAPPDPDPGGDPPAPIARWRSGVTRPEGAQQYTQISVDQWGAWRQRPCDITLTYTNRTGSWADLVAPGYTVNNWTQKNLTVVIGQPFTPSSLGDGANGNQARAILNGAGNAYWPQWGTTLKNKEAQGFVPYVTEFGWEFNGSWMHHSATNPTEFVGAYRRCVDLVRSTHPDAIFSWTVNAGYSQNPPSHDARNCYPGDDYVDIIGVDLYDHFPQAIGYAAVDNREQNNVGRAEYWREFAYDHNKPMMFPEWGLNNSTDDQANGGRDNPDYIEWMHDFFTQLDEDDMLFGEIYYNDRNTKNVWSDLMEGSRNPQSSLRYRQLWLPAQP